MTDAMYAAACDCEAFAVNTAGTDWSKDQLVALARTHLEQCPSDFEEIDVLERDDDGDETFVETVSLEVGSL